MQMKSYLNKPIQTFVQRTLFGDQANTPPKKKNDTSFDAFERNRTIYSSIKGGKKGNKRHQMFHNSTTKETNSFR